ncbi:ATP-dependent DNA helicase DinG [Sporosarcina highlanderae]|uniref:3'-5' exonuclease DinG n=1 Tax=Sporosarcina highlanderae TaxID=3035916 RepID=A0ABT8JUT7_9BACL|nr:ATP-dependent DNA helicase DinG [Sporosarcina highlanderae]MDN4608712.1 ATP-dependent DNA helicase DinG [Sporosarcina highlanderae]
MDNRTYAVVDLETTGHSPLKGDRVIQIAIVFIENGAISRKYARFVNPGRDIPSFIQQLTSITDKEVASAPSFEQIAQEVSDLLQGTVFVAHNTDFDLSFLQSEFKRCKVPTWSGKKIDTVELSKILFPSSSSYRLQDLAEDLNIPLPTAHRADDDAEATAHLLLAALSKLHSLPEETLNLLHRRSFSLRSDISSLFYEALKSVRQDNKSVKLPLFRGIPYRDVKKTVESVALRTMFPIQEDEKIQLLEKGYPSFEYRKPQLEFMDTAWNALQSSTEVIAEVPTGIGKTVGYLLPAAIHSFQTGKPVVISTFTNHLVDKILEDEVQRIRDILDIDCTAAVLKGKEQYISLGKFEELLRITDESYDETFTIMQILVWLTETGTGDLNELNVSGGGQLFIDRIRKRNSKMSEDEKVADYHQKMMDACSKTNLVITNHSMLLSDSQREQRILHSYSGLIIDEAHQFIHTAVRSNEIVLSYMNWKYVIGQIGSDAEGQLLHKIIKLHNRFSNFGQQIVNQLAYSYDQFTSVFDKVAFLLSSHRPKTRGGQHGNRVVFALAEVRDEPIFARVAEKMSDYIESVQTIQTQLEVHKPKMSKKEEALLAEWEYWLRELKIKAGEWVEIFLDDSNENFTVWIEKDKRSLPGSLNIVKSPIDASVLIKEFTTRMNQEKIGIVWTSGTMTIKNNERFVAQQLGISDGVPIKSFAAPRQFYDKAAIFIVDDMPSIQHVSQNDYIEAVADAVVQTVIATGGRLFVLFTSQDMLRKTYELILDSELLSEYALIAQGVSSGSRLKLLKSFRQFDKSVLFGTNSFWEGVDVPGEALSAVIIVRLPFTSPDEMIFKARAEKLNAIGVNPFTDLALPEAILRFRQGFGRLIRSSEDRGFFIILDRRIETKSYGKSFLNALPSVPIKNVSLEHMVKSLEDCYNE